MQNAPSEPHIDLEARVRDEEGKRLIAASDTVDIDQLADTVRIERTPRAQAPEREMLQQQIQLD
jgi:hypothetical protein